MFENFYRNKAIASTLIQTYFTENVVLLLITLKLIIFPISQGCIKPIEVDDKMYGLPNAVVTYGVSPKCVWWYPCHANPSNPPCVPQSVCEQHGVDHFTCKCDSELCINPDYAEKYKVST